MKNILYIGNKLKARGVNLSTIDTLGALLELEGYKVFYASSKSNKFLRVLDMVWACIKYSKHVDFVLIDTYSTLNFYYAFIVSRICRLFNLKYIPILHGGNLPKRLEKSRKLSKALFNNAYKNVAPSLYTQSSFEAFGYNNIVCIPNSIELKNYPFKVREFDKIKLLWVRSFSRIYNPLLAIKIIKALKDENIEAELCMVGPEKDGSLQDARKLAKTLNVDVKFTGGLSKEAWIRLSEDYNMFINTTNFDNMPVSVIEAMALGLPIISTNVGGMPFLIKDKEDGVLVNPNDLKAFVEAIKTIFKFPQEANKNTFAVRKRTNKFDWKIVKNQWVSLFR